LIENGQGESFSQKPYPLFRQTQKRLLQRIFVHRINAREWQPRADIYNLSADAIERACSSFANALRVVLERIRERNLL